MNTLEAVAMMRSAMKQLSRASLRDEIFYQECIVWVRVGFYYRHMKHDFCIVLFHCLRGKYARCRILIAFCRRVRNGTAALLTNTKQQQKPRLGFSFRFPLLTG